MANRYFLKLAYDGTPFHGWQIQPNAKSIQETLNKVFSTLLRSEIYTVGCGRTDAGVHAKQFYAHFEITTPIESLSDLQYRSNQMLPKEIAISDIFPVAAETHTRFSAIARTYEYLITTQKDPFSQSWKLEYRQPLDIERMNEACKVLFEFEDFESFSRTGGQTEHHLCRMMKANWEASGNELKFTIAANRFLRNMVRAIVGTMLDVGLGKLSIEDFRNIIAAKSRGRASSSAPAHGLYLVKIDYPKELNIK